MLPEEEIKKGLGEKSGSFVPFEIIIHKLPTHFFNGKKSTFSAVKTKILWHVLILFH